MNTTNTSTKKTTKRDYFMALLDIPAVKENQSLYDFINHEIELLAKKNSTVSKKISERQKDNMTLAEIITAYLDKDNGKTISELIKEIPELNGLSTQRVSPIMSELVAQNKAVRGTFKGRTLFYAAE